MRQGNHGGAWGAWVKGMIIAVVLAVAWPAAASSPPAAISMADVADTASAESGAQRAGTRGLPEKPAGLDDAGWASLQQAIRKSSQQAKLSGEGSVAGADGAANDFFGYSVALSGDTALVGAYLDDVGANGDRGSAYVFTRSGTTWTQQAKLVAGDGAANDQFGVSVALSGDTALVGAQRDDVGANSNQGSAYVFTRSGTTWTQQAQLVAGDGAANDFFGYSVALSGDTALVGAYADDVGANSNQGSAYVFTRSGTTWTQQAQLVASDGAANDFFGYSVALSGDTALVGASADDVGANGDQGSAYVYARSGTTWTQQAKLVAGDGAANDFFGYSVALSGDTALVGAYADDVGAIGDQGSAYVYARSGTTWTQQAKLVAGDGAANDQFGWSVALSGDTALVGAYVDDVGANSNQGSAYVYTRSGTTWTQQAKLVASDGAAFDQFGSSVALSGDTALVGAFADVVGANSNQGSAYVYTRSGTTWTQQAKLVAGDGAADDRFGYSVALSGDTALVGAYADDVGANSIQGSAYVFTRSGTTWTQQAKLVASDGAAGDQFGWSVALSGDTALVGAYADAVGANSNQGSAYVYTRSGTTWTQQAKLVAGDGAVFDRFGWSVALSGDTALVGAYFDAVGANGGQGSAYVFTRSGTTWTQQAQLVAGDGAANDFFGYSVALSGDTALMGASADDVGANGDQGSAYVYARSGTTWTQQAKLVAGDGAANDQFGFSVALSGDTALVGARADDVGANGNQGSAYVYTRSGTTWTQQAKLVAGDGAANDLFGGSVALSGDTALVGAYVDDVGANGDQGSAYVYTRSGTTWTQQAKLVAGDGAAGDQFGFSVALSSGTALVGAPFVDGVAPFGNPDEGATYVFTGVGLQSQSTTFANPGPQAFGTTPTLTATASSGLPVVFSSLTSGVCSITAGGTLTFLTTGTCTINADQPGGGSFIPAPTVSQSFAVNAVAPGAPTIGTATAGNAHATVTFTAPSFTGGASISGYTVTANPGGLIGTGTGSPITVTGLTNGVSYTFTVTATNSAGPGAASAPSNAVTLRGPQALLTAIASPSTIGFGGSSTLSTTGGSGTGAVTYVVTAGATFCSVSGTTLTGTGVGTCTVTATKAGDASFNATSATVDVTVNRANQAAFTATASPSTIAFGGTSTLATTGGSGTGAVNFVVTAGASFCSLSGSTLTGTAVGTCTITATKAADANYNAATATIDVTVNRANQAPLTLTATPAAVPLTRTAALSVAGGSGTGAISYAVTAGGTFCSISGTTLTGTGVGTCTITATKAADAEYNATAAQADVVIQAATDLEVSKSDGTPWAIPDSTVLYEIQVANAGPLAVQGARLRDLLPAGLVDGLWTCTPVQLATCPQAAGTGNIDQLLDLPVNGILRYQLSARVTAPLGSMLTNTATVEVPATVIELEPADNSASDTNSVVPEGIFWNGFEPPPQAISVPSGGR